MNESVSKSIKPAESDVPTEGTQEPGTSKLESSMVSKQETAMSKRETEKAPIKTQAPKIDQNDEAYIASVIKEAVDCVIGDAVFTPLKTQKWSNEIINTISKRFLSNGENRKFVIHTILTPSGKNHSLCTATQSYWNDLQDVAHLYHWESSTTIALISIFFFSHRASHQRSSCTIQ